MVGVVADHAAQRWRRQRKVQTAKALRDQVSASSFFWSCVRARLPQLSAQFLKLLPQIRVTDGESF